MPNTRIPRITGFDMPSTSAASLDSREPVIAMLDIEPDAAWTAAFMREMDGAENPLLGVVAIVEGRSIVLVGFDGDPRRLSVQMRALVDRANASRRDEQSVDDGDARGGFGQGSFRRND